MRIFVLLLVVVLVGCVGANKDGQDPYMDYVDISEEQEQAYREAWYKNRDDWGFKDNYPLPLPAYNRAPVDGWNPALDNPEPKSSYRTKYRYRDNYNYSGDTDSFGTPVYSPDECIGPIIMGECHGTVLPKAGYRKKCYGTMLNGRCTGPMY